MPEMPEVETVVRSLRRHLPGKRLRRAEVYDPKLNRLDTTALAGRVVRAVVRSGKEIVVDLSRPHSPLWLCVHLRMTGSLHWSVDEGPAGQKSARACFVFTDGNLYFLDPRRFGVIRLARRAEEIAAPGVEILSPEFTVPRLAQLLQGGRGPLKPWLLRQDRIVGFGNIYASEVCHRAGLDPRRPAGSLTPAEIKRLHRITREVFTEAIRLGGTTISDFNDCDGECGGYQHRLRVYEREGERCRRRGCGGTICRLVQAGRSTYYCPTCQR
ncbi:MAG: bifunctional DNA-formamidopyrimidine glycosylase/DNA-(apurinic or apyrimidinic site) lyase [Myxococcales bacterium]|nr:bifunctional DNA-formamidopyrimidine glycosylase/DNA-(apurinic or apyrimidinic site) lyase [Myxococcales bacterium]